MLDIDALINHLVKGTTSETMFNPFKDYCVDHDLPNGPSLRVENLRQYLKAQWKLQPESLWVGEAPSFNGVRRSGIYLISEPHLDDLAKRLGTDSFQKTTRTPNKATMTSRFVWKLLQLMPELPLTFDAMPFQTLRETPPYGNRNPGKKELRAHLSHLKALIDGFKPKHIIAIGRKAAFALEEIEVKAQYVRHPARGGSPEFERGIKEYYGI